MYSQMTLQNNMVFNNMHTICNNSYKFMKIMFTSKNTLAIYVYMPATHIGMHYNTIVFPISQHHACVNTYIMLTNP